MKEDNVVAERRDLGLVAFELLVAPDEDLLPRVAVFFAERARATSVAVPGQTKSSFAAAAS